MTAKRVGILAGVLFAAVLAMLAWRAADAREPTFEGRKLSSWLDHHVASSAANPPYGSPGWLKAEEALRSIGTNAIPTLLNMLRSKDPPPPVLKLIQEANQRGWIRIKYRYAVARHEEAEYAFGILHTNAASAVPQLVRIYEQAISPSSQRCAALSLGHVGREARAALPSLIRNFNHTNTDVRFNAVTAVMHIGGEPEAVLPALSRALKDPDVAIRWNALAGFSRFGRQSRPYVPQILPMLEDTGRVGDSRLVEQVETTLWRIAPEKVGKPLVVEEATTMISNGVTTEALKVLYNGKHQTLIPAGRAVPALGQYWNSDPQPRLTLYRGAEAHEANDHFLGHFEVLNVPASDHTNVSTLCVIADGRIVLCARENQGDVFLAIRRLPD